MTNYEIIPIANGVSLSSVPVDHFKTDIITMSISLPLDGDIEANALLSYLLRHGTKKYPSLTMFNSRLAELYGASLGSGVSKRGESQVITYRITSINDKFSLGEESISECCADFLLELLFNPKTVDGSFTDEDIETEKRLLLERIDSEFSEKRVYALKRLVEEMCRNEKYGTDRYGKIEKIKTINAERVNNAYKNFLENSVIRINVVGKLCDNMITMLKNKFGSINRTELPELKTEYVVSASDVRKVNEKLAVKQGKLVIGLRAGMTEADDNYYALRVMTDMFGGGPYSKLFTNVREKMSLCYYCSARLSRDKGIIIVQSGIEEENEEKAEKAILAELKNMQDGNFTEDELSNSIKGLTDAVKGVFDTPEGIDAWLTSEALSKEYTSPAKYIEKIKTITPEQVRVAAMGVTVDTIYMLSSDNADKEAEA